MAIQIDHTLTPKDLLLHMDRFWALSGEKILHIEENYDRTQGSPVYTEKGVYTTRGWTEWTQGFEFGSALLQFDATGDEQFLDLGRRHTLSDMATHITHTGVHDHGFNNISTYGNLLRLMNEERIPENEWERHFYELAIKCSGAVQARRWSNTSDGDGYIYSFNGPHSLFADTIRSLRALAVSWQLGHVLQDEHDERICLLDRLLQHARSTSRYTVYYGEGRDAYDLRGRTAHESVFNMNDGNYRCPNSQQGYSPFSTWTRGLAWVVCGYAEELEFIQQLPEASLEAYGGKQQILEDLLKPARASADFYLEHTPVDGIPYWDTGAPELHHLGDDVLDKPADPYNDFEPVDSTAAAITCQGLIRLGSFLQETGEDDGDRYLNAGLTTLRTLLQDPYQSTDTNHQGLLLHSIYHRPNGWDYIPEGSKIPCGESSMWGDYHIREAALLVQRMAEKKPYYTFFIQH